MLNALFQSKRLEPDEQGTVTLAELESAMVAAGVPRRDVGVLRFAAAIGSGGAGGLVASSLGEVDDHRVNLGFHLLNGVLAHEADTGVLGDPPGIKEARFEELVAHAEERTGPDGKPVRVMTRESYLKALDARLDGERARRGSATRGLMLAGVEAQLIPAVFGELTVEQLRAFYFEGKIPPPAAEQPEVTKLLGAVMSRLPRGVSLDISRLFGRG